VSSAHPSPADNNADPAALYSQLTALQSSLERLVATTEREHERAAHREAVIDRLHEENTRLRRGELQAMFDPVRAALYRLHDLTRRESARWRSDPPDPQHAADLLSAVADEIAEALARTGVERFTVAPGEPYDPARHRPVASEPVADPELDGSVLRVHADGFASGDRVVRKAEVCVGRPASANGPTVRAPSPS
jgi:molecular chaperone GrpE